MAQLIVELWRWISVGALVFQAAASSAVTSRQTAKRSSISVRHWVALSRCLRGRKCAEMALKADRNRWACRKAEDANAGVVNEIFHIDTKLVDAVDKLSSRAGL